LNSTTNEIEGTNENNMIITIILDDIDEHIRVAKLETLPSMKSDMIGSFVLFEFIKNKSFSSSSNLC
jgi:hypothetical protein